MGNSYNTDKRGKFDKYKKLVKNKKHEYKVRNRWDGVGYPEWEDRSDREIVCQQPLG